MLEEVENVGRYVALDHLPRKVAVLAEVLQKDENVEDFYRELLRFRGPSVGAVDVGSNELSQIGQELVGDRGMELLQDGYDSYHERDSVNRVPLGLDEASKAFVVPVGLGLGLTVRVTVRWGWG